MCHLFQSIMNPLGDVGLYVGEGTLYKKKSLFFSLLVGILLTSSWVGNIN